MTASMTAAARFEFRAFAWQFGLPVVRLRRAGSCSAIEERRESYLMAPGARDINLKLRGNEALNIKELLERHQALERWQPRPTHPLPLSGEVVAMELFPALGLPPPDPPLDCYDRPALTAALTDQPGAVVVEVLKRRHRFELDRLKAEYTRVWFNGAGLTTLAVEGEDSQDVLEGIRLLALTDYHNVSYPRAIRRILGLETLPGDWLEIL
ncbi:MAG: hypothetical protein R3310_03015 [Candidatus Competibacteraceae bacterium]|nr:hypothetical protein [Candidatus Competibacteraceae bacterium]